MSHTYLESHGVKLDVEVQHDALLPSVERILPPGWKPLHEFPEDGHFTLSRAEDGTYGVYAEGAPLGTGLTAELAINLLDARIRERIATLAREYVFVHAGVVAVEGRALVLPAPSFAGKTSLVAALVARGASYFSDEFAVLSRDGLVHPYAKPLSVRAAGARPGEVHPGEDRPVEALGGIAGVEPCRIAMIVATRYVPGAEWAPDRHGSGVGALQLLSNAVPARERTEQALSVVGRAAHGAITLLGDRGEADKTAATLLDELAKRR